VLPMLAKRILLSFHSSVVIQQRVPNIKHIFLMNSVIPYATQIKNIPKFSFRIRLIKKSDAKTTSLEIKI
jgi:hypothetical protein